MGPLPTARNQPLPCFLHIPTVHVFCGPQNLLYHTFESTGHKGELVPLSCNTTVFSDPNRFSVIDPVNDDNWETYLNARIPVVLQSRSAEPEAEAVAEPADTLYLVPRAKKPKVTNTNGTSAAGKVAVSGLGFWVALGWLITGVAPL